MGEDSGIHPAPSQRLMIYAANVAALYFKQKFIMNHLKIIYFTLTILTGTYLVLNITSIGRTIINLFYKLISKTSPSKSPPREMTHKKRPMNVGFVMATHYSDQLSGSVPNLLSLQCWVATLPGRVRVVEPFLHYGSILGFNLNPYPDKTKRYKRVKGPSYGERLKLENEVKLSDVLDIKEFVKYASLKGVAPLVSWSYFMNDMPRNLILVDQICEDSTTLCMACHVHDPADDFFESNIFLKFGENFAKYHKLQVVRRVCYQRNIQYDDDELKDNIYGNFSPQNSIVMFNHFGGFSKSGDSFRTSSTNSECYREEFFHSFRSSYKIVDLSKKYVMTYMPKAMTKGYIALLLRSEKTLHTHQFKTMSKEEQMSTLKDCLEEVVDSVHSVRASHGILELFVATDIGKYGSAYTREGVDDVLPYKDLEEFMKTFYSQLFGNPDARSVMAERIEKITPIQSPGYVAQIEKTIAVNSTCLVLSGGGFFQKSAKLLYKQFKDEEDLCIMELGNCLEDI